METREQEVLTAPSTLRGVSATWHRNARDGCRSHRSAPRRSEALLGQIELAGALQEMPRQEDKERGQQSDVSVLKGMSKKRNLLRDVRKNPCPKDAIVCFS